MIVLVEYYLYPHFAYSPQEYCEINVTHVKVNYY